MFAITPAFDVVRIRRRPRDWQGKQAAGWLYLPRNSAWDASARERLRAATGLSALSQVYGEHAPDSWWRAFLCAYLSSGDAVASVRAAGEA
jgi:hypothetical protein